MNQRKIKQSFHLICLILAGLMPFHVSLAETENVPLFQKNSHFDYDIYWSFLKIGSAQLSFHDIEIPKSTDKKYEVRFSVKSNELVSAIYPIESHIVSSLIISNDQIKPSIYTKNSNEGGKQSDSIVRFNYQLNQITEEKDETLLQPIEITKDLQDPLSLIVAICQNDFQIDPIFQQDVSDGGQIISIRSSYLQSETIKTQLGEFRTEVIDIDPQRLRGVFKKSPDANVVLYLSEHSPAIPLKLKSKVRVGSFYAILSGGIYQGNPIKGKQIESPQKPLTPIQGLKRRFKR
ncbi:MAG: DUF3108 domain-containing protein [Opitutales bacterium TMED207]|nr:hypothetical protein [Puniceicoccaceae bacterium]RPG15154.1 MAG: DUF3108 domain-containing protein [Opitutales bacterium TMED207]